MGHVIASFSQNERMYALISGDCAFIHIEKLRGVVAREATRCPFANKPVFLLEASCTINTHCRKTPVMKYESYLRIFNLILIPHALNPHRLGRHH